MFDNITNDMFEDYMEDMVRTNEQIALENLKSIDSNLQNYTPEEVSVIMDFLCKDESFKTITDGDACKLHEYLCSKYSKEDAVVAGYVIGQAIATGLQVWAIWKWVDQKTVRGVAEWIDKNGFNSVESEMFEYKARVPQAMDFQKIQASITKCLPTLGKLLDGKPVSDTEIQSNMRTLGFNVDLSRFDDYGGHLWAFLVACVKNLGLQVLASGAIIIVTILTLGILYIPVAIAAGIWVNVKTGAAYKRAYEEFQWHDSLQSHGWTKQTFSASLSEFKKHYLAIRYCASRLNKLKGGEIYTPESSGHARLFADTLYMAVKMEARVLGTIIAVTDRQLDLRLTP